MDGSLFISYSHIDLPWMQVFKKHLNGILMDVCRVWTDEDISAGTTWEEALLGNLEQAAAGLVLVSPDYLVSPWCRRELKVLADARKSQQLDAVYWVLLKPGGWKWTDLADLQAVQEPADAALLSLPESEREGHILRCCETIATSLKALFKGGDKALGAIREILLRSEHRASIRVLKTLSEGDFSIVGRGVKAGGDEVVIKVLTNTPLRRLRELFFEVCTASKDIAVPSVVRTTSVFKDGEGYDERVVILCEMAHGQLLSKLMEEDNALPARERHLTLDTIGVLLRRVAEAIQGLHSMKPILWEGGGNQPYQHLVGPLSPANIFYDPATQRPQVSVVGVSNFLWRFLDPETFRSIVGPKSGVYLLPEKDAGGSVDFPADQYFLGLLALELLEGRPLFTAADHQQPPDPLEILKSARWTIRHEQLGAIVARLLASNPMDRYTGITEVIENLEALEESSRALAKYSFRTYVACDVPGDSPRPAFAESFYANLCRSDAVRDLFVTAHRKRALAVLNRQESPTIPDETQRRKLVDGLKAVLNFRPGCSPSSIDSVAARHVDFNLTTDHFDVFEKSFLETLEQHVTRSEDREEMEEIAHAWEKLFATVRDEMLGYARRCNLLAASARASDDHFEKADPGTAR